MNRENIAKLKEQVNQTAKWLYGFDGVMNSLTNEERTAIQQLQKKLSPIISSYTDFIGQQSSALHAGIDYEEKRIEKMREMARDAKSASIQESLISNCLQLVSFVQDSQSSGVSDYDIALGIKAMQNSLQLAQNLNLPEPIRLIRDNAIALASSFASEYLAKLTPEEQQAILENKTQFAGTFIYDMPYELKQGVVFALEENRNADIQLDGVDSPDVDKLTLSVIDNFVVLNDTISKSEYSEFDSNKINEQLGVLVSDFTKIKSASQQSPTTNSINERLLANISRATRKSISQIMDFIPETFERSVISAKNLIESGQVLGAERTELINDIVKNSVIYMYSKDDKFVFNQSLIDEIKDLVKKTDGSNRGTDLSSDTVIQSNEQTTTATSIDNTSEQDVIQELQQEDVVGQHILDTENVYVNASESIEIPVFKQDTVLDSTRRTAPTNSSPNIRTETIQHDSSSLQKHPLERYKSLIEKYDVQFVKDDRFPDGHFVVTERATGKVPEYIPSEQRPQLTKDLAFAKSWISSCSSGLSTSGKVNEFGYDERVWEYAFNDGAMDTFTSIVDLLKNNTNPNLNTDMIINMVSSGSTYKYSSSIVQSLLRERDNPYILNNIHERLLAEAGFGHDISQVLDSDGMDMNN